MSVDENPISSGELREGDLCHDFLMKTVDQRILEAGDYRGRKVWLAFYRYAGCPMCASHVAQVIEAKSLLETSNITFVAVYDCAADRVPTWIRRSADERFQVVADESQGLHEKFGATKSYAKLFSPGSAIAFVKAASQGHMQGSIDGSLAMMPAHILVDESGRVVCAYYAKNAGDNIPWKLVRAFAEMQPKTVEEQTELDERTLITMTSQAPLPVATAREFAVNYKWKLKIGAETDFLETWIRLEEKTRQLHPEYMGARLYLDAEQYVAAFSVWSDKSAWEKFWITKEQALPESLLLASYVERSFEPQICRSIYDSVKASALNVSA